jgi:glutamyl-tRNA synthetase
MGGAFILRIEDTDQNRYVQGAVENLIQSLKTVGLEYDEGPEIEGNFGPYFQSQRTEIYKNYAAILVEKGAAYPCFCSEAEIETMRQEQKEKGHDPKYDKRCANIPAEEAKKRIANGEPHVIRLNIPEEGEITFFDVVREKVTFPCTQLDDQVLIKSDGFPTYHLANVVDDHLMEISHVIRGEEWLSSTPKHILMYEAFGWKPPKWIHLPLILNPDHSKLSKRQGDVATEDFLKKGFLPEAILNYIALLGWHPAGDRELFSLAELIEAFSLKRISKSGAVFDIEKLRWMNGHYLKTLELEAIIKKAKPFLDEATQTNPNLTKMIDFARERVVTLAEIPQILKPFTAELNFSDEDWEILHAEKSQAVFKFWLEKMEYEEELNTEKINALIKETTKSMSVKGKDLYFPLRLVLFGSCHGPEIPQLFEILGKERAMARIEAAMLKGL